MLKGIKAVIFDLDGSLVDSMWMWEQIDVEYLMKFGISLPVGLQAEIEGMSFSETAAYFKDKFKLPVSVEEIKTEWNQMAFEKYSREVPLKKGADTFLKYCLTNQIKLGIATSNSRELVEQVISAHHMTDYFSCIMTGCEVGKGKPAPDIYLAVADQLKTSPCDCLVFEDIIPGILAGKAAGMRVCAVEDKYSAAQKAEKTRLADYYIEDYTTLAALDSSWIVS